MDINDHLGKITFAIKNKDEIIFLNLIKELESLKNSSLEGIIELNKNIFYLNLNFSKDFLLKFIASQKKFGTYPIFFQAVIFFTFAKKYLLPNYFMKEISIEILYLYKNKINIIDVNKIIFNEEFFNEDIYYSDAFFDYVVIPSLTHLAEIKNTEVLLNNESLIYKNYIIKIDSEAHFSKVYNQLIPIYENHGKNYTNEYLSFPFKKINTKLQLIAFFIHRASTLAHIETLLNFLEGYQKIEVKKFTPIIFVYNGFYEELDFMLKKLKIETIYIDKLCKEINNKKFSSLEKFLIIKSIIKNNNIKVLVFVSLVMWMAFAFAMRIAKIQVWWSMKYCIPFGNFIDMYLTGGAQGEISRNVNGINWLTAPSGIANLFDKSKTIEAKEMRANFPNDKIILGSFAREEKLNFTQFLEAVSLILETNPNTIFLWTGRTKQKNINQFFNSKNLSSRVIYIGWVDTKVYAQVIDIFLDTFPNPAGFTIYYAMAASVACVFGGIDNKSMGIQSSINPLFFNTSGNKLDQLRVQEIFNKDSSQPLYMIADNNEDYVFIASKLIRDKKFREKVGKANQLFMNEFFSSPIKMASGYAFHLNKLLS